jgi:hypothetical protein
MPSVLHMHSRILSKKHIFTSRASFSEIEWTWNMKPLLTVKSVRGFLTECSSPSPISSTFSLVRTRCSNSVFSLSCSLYFFCNHYINVRLESRKMFHRQQHTAFPGSAVSWVFICNLKGTGLLTTHAVTFSASRLGRWNVRHRLSSSSIRGKL